MDNDLQVLPHVDLEHFVHATQGLLDREFAKVVDQPLRDQSQSAFSFMVYGVATHLWVEEVGVHDDTLDVGTVFVVLKSL